MTAINVFCQRHRVAILTDAVAYDLEGRVKGFYTKCYPITHLRAAVATRGTAMTTALFAANFGLQFVTFDELVEDGGDFAEDLYDDVADSFCSGESEVEIFLAGWSESRNRPESYFLVSHDKDGRKPWVFHKADPIFVAPVITQADMIQFGLNPGMAPENVDPVIDGIKILEAQRSLELGTSTYGEDVGVHVVGGFALLTEIKADGISQRIVHRWPEDRIGQLIRPKPIVADTSPPMNRQQRRQAEREASKRKEMAR